MNKGFTLIEVLVVMVIVGILAASTIVAVNPMRNINQAKDANVKSDMSQIIHGLKAYQTADGRYPNVGNPPLQNLVVSKDFDALPKQPDGTNYQYQRSTTCDPSSCSAVVWGKLYNAPVGTVWCWDSTNNQYKESTSAPASGETICP